MTLNAESTVEPCALHKLHTPRNLTTEWHHVIPVAWQLATTLNGSPPYPGEDPDGRGMLWDDRGIWLCPTDHRNVHRWIVGLMHAAAAAGSTDPLVAYKAVRPRVPPKEFAIAYDALTRFMGEAGYGGSQQAATLLTLTAAGEWGQA